MKIQSWDEKLFRALVDQKDTVTKERFIEAQLVYYYQRMDTQDLITAGGIPDIEENMVVFCCQIWDFVHYFLCIVQKVRTSTNLFSKMK